MPAGAKPLYEADDIIRVLRRDRVRDLRDGMRVGDAPRYRLVIYHVHAGNIAVETADPTRVRAHRPAEAWAPIDPWRAQRRDCAGCGERFWSEDAGDLTCEACLRE